MNCDGCGFDRLMVEGHAYDGLDLCPSCVEWLDMFRGMDAKGVQSVLAAYRSRKANRAKGTTA